MPLNPSFRYKVACAIPADLCKHGLGPGREFLGASVSRDVSRTLHVSAWSRDHNLLVFGAALCHRLLTTRLLQPGSPRAVVRKWAKTGRWFKGGRGPLLHAVARAMVPSRPVKKLQERREANTSLCFQFSDKTLLLRAGGCSPL